MAELFAIFGVVMTVAGALFVLSGGLGYLTDRHNWEFNAYLWCMLISTTMITICIITHMLKLFQ